MSRKPYGPVIILILLALLIPAVALGQEGTDGAAGDPGERGRAVPIVRESDANDTTPPLHTIRPHPPRAGELLELPRKWLPNRQESVGPFDSDPIVQTEPGTEAMPGTVANFEGINNRDAVLPPDTNGDVGPNHYVQMVNLSFAIYSKTGALLYGPARINTLWSGFGGACETTNNGDPIVLYDHLADRWLMSQFALPNYPFGPFYECIAISQTPDPTGAWYRYAFLISNTKMDDYPKLAVWPDGYYMSINQFQQGTLGWAGAGAVVFERDKMLLGQTARMVYFDLFSVDSNLGGMLPADLDGSTLPAAGAPNPFVQVDDNAWGYSPDQLQVWNFQVNWTTPNSSIFTRAITLPTATFDSNMCGYVRNCISQPGGTKVDAIADRLMYRLQYRNFGSYEALVTNHTVDVNGADRAGVRWYELRKSGGNWSIYQQGTYSPDANHRWMGSIAMDNAGNIALGYSVSSTSVYPSIRYTGRLPGDPLGQLPQGESTLIAGSGYQTHSSGRWGDYSSMMVDPADDCTFWYTTEYYNGVSSAGWRTRIGSFRFPSCSGLPPTPTATPTNTPTPTVTPTATNTPPSTPSMHVGSLVGTAASTSSSRWRAMVAITVHDAAHQGLSGAAVTGTWSAGGSSTCTTGSSGQCSVIKSNLSKSKTPSVTFNVTGVTKTGYTYVSSANHNPAGSIITVSRP